MIDINDDSYITFQVKGSLETASSVVTINLNVVIIFIMRAFLFYLIMKYMRAI